MLDPADFRLLMLKFKGHPGVPALPAHIQEDLKDSLIEIAAYYGEAIKGFLRGERRNPGYLKGICGEWVVYVPWPLAPYFPKLEPLSSILSLAAQTSLGTGNSVCVSGSGALMGSKMAIGDLDFCQYVTQAPSSVVVDAERFLSPSPYRILVYASYGKTTRAKAPWESFWPSLRERMLGCTSIDGAERFMVEFIGKCPDFGVLPASTVILSADYSDRSKGAASASFVYQEAIAFKSSNDQDLAIWSLADAVQIGEYLCFLHQQITELVNKKPVKAVKRTFSLASLMRLESTADAALAILVKPELAEYVEHQRAQEVQRMVADCGVDERSFLEREFGLPKEQPQSIEGASLSDSIPDLCRTLVDQLQSEFDQLDIGLFGSPQR